jgi:hypothetical protein
MLIHGGSTAAIAKIEIVTIMVRYRTNKKEA